jgi:hypothetical protein
MARKVLKWFSWKDITHNPGDEVQDGELPEAVSEYLDQQGVLEPAPTSGPRREGKGGGAETEPGT